MGSACAAGPAVGRNSIVAEVIIEEWYELALPERDEQKSASLSISPLAKVRISCHNRPKNAENALKF